MQVSETGAARWGTWSRGVVVVLAALVVVAGCGSAGRVPAGPSSSSSSPVAPTTEDGTYRLIQEPQGGYESVSRSIASANTSVRLGVYELDDSSVESALVDAHARGVDVRVLLDAAFHGKKTNQAAFDALRAAGVGVVWAPANRIVHEKVLVVDSSAIVSTANFQSKYYGTSRDALIEVRDRDEVSAIAATFDADYAAVGTGRLAQATEAGHLVWSPAARNVFIRTIEDARRALDLTTEEFKDHAVAQAITHAVGKGVQCRMVLNADQESSGAVKQVRDAGCAVRLIPKSSTGLYMHEKVLVVDGGLSCIIGSTNLSTMSLTQNRELSLRLDNTVAPKLIAVVEDQFNSDFNMAAAS